MVPVQNRISYFDCHCIDKQLLDFYADNGVRVKVKDRFMYRNILMNSSGQYRLAKQRFNDVMTHRSPLTKAADGYDVFKNKKDDCVKMVMTQREYAKYQKFTFVNFMLKIKKQFS